MKIIGSLAEKLWHIEVHLHRECYGYDKIGKKLGELM